MNLEDILSRHLTAAGGRVAVESLRALRVDLHIVEPEFTVDGVYIAERTGRMRVDIYMEEVRVFSEGVVDGRGWQLPGGAETAVPTSPDGTAALLRGIENNLYGLHELPARGHRLGLQSAEVVDGIEYVVLQQVYPDGGEVLRLLNPATWRVERSREVKALHPDIDPTKTTVETRYSEFREVGGLVRPFAEQTVDLQTGETLQTVKVGEMVVNPVLGVGDFERP